MQFHLTLFSNLNWLNIIKNILPQQSQNHNSGWCQEKHLHCTISRCLGNAFSELLENKCLYIPVNLRSNILVPET